MRCFPNIILLAWIAAAWGCGGEASPAASPPGAIRVSDFRGREIELSQQPRRVVCLIESALSGIYMLGAEDRVLGVSANVYQGHLFDAYARLDPRISRRELPAPGNWDFISLEQVAVLRPDLVIIWASQTEAIGQLEALDIPVYGVMLHSLDDVYKEISDLGLLFGKEARADSLIDFTRSQLEALRAGLPAADTVSVYFMWAQGELETSGLNSTVNELIEAAGARNACRLEDEHLAVNAERLAGWDPGMIVMWPNDRLDPADVRANPLFQSLRAVREGRVYELPSPFACDLWTLKVLHAARLLAHWAYPEQALRPDEEALFDFLYGKNWNR